MPTCPNCGQENPDIARFCLACATPLHVEAEAREERKILTVLFADLVGFTSRAERLDPEDVRALLSPYYVRLRSELERRGGTVEKFIGDAVMALFGAPVAHEDDPERALRAALAIRDAIADLNEGDPALELQVRIAVTTGEALVALGARPSEGEGMASGDVVNTAARLQAAAPVNGILVDETTYRATQRAIVYHERHPVVVKGKADAIPVWEVEDARARFGVDLARTGSAPLVGREKELDLLLDALARAREERAPQLVTLVGVPGIGKSRLVYELSSAVDADPELIYWRQGRSLPYGDGVTFWALAEIVKAQSGILETDAGDTARQKLRVAVQEAVADPAEVDWVERHLSPLVGLGEDAPPSGDRQAEAFTAWRRFLEGLAEQNPLVLVFEDLHWADDGLLDFVDHLVEWASGVPLLAVCTARPELLTRRPGWGGGKPNAVTASLSPLSQEDTARLVAALLEQAVLPAEVQTALLARAEGNPLYAEEYVRMLQDRGFLHRERGGWRLERAEELPLPESVQGLIAARLDALPSEEKALLQAASVIGKVFWLGALAAISEESVSPLEDRLHGVERKEFIRRERRSSVASETQYAFLHLLVRDVAYGQIPRPARAEKHRRAAQWIESLSPDRSEDRAEMLAYHYLSALELARAAGLETETLAKAARVTLREAGDHASALNALTAAARFYAAALELWPRDEVERPQVLLRYGRALFPLGTGEVILAEARDALLAAGDHGKAAEAEALLAWLVWDTGERDRSFEHIERAEALIADAGVSRSTAYVMSSVSRFFMNTEEHEKAISIGRQALAIAEELGLEELRAAALDNIGTARVSAGDWGGLDDIERSIELAKGINSPEAWRGMVNLAACLGCLGDLNRAFALIEEGTPVAEHFGFARQLRWLRAERATAAYFTGRWDESMQLADEFIAEAEAGSPHYLESVCREYRGRIRLARGDVAGAVEDADRELELVRVSKDPQVLYPALSFRALALVAAGRTAEAADHATELLSQSREERLVGGLAWEIDLAFVLEALGRGADFLAAAAERPETRWSAAGRAFVSGDYGAAAEILAEIGSLPDEAYARLRAAEALVADERRAEADVQLTRALSFFRSVGATVYVQRGEALLAATA
jgi:class 3 adenylate cyclase/tetratricopeptide (TPR) repeat protein